MVDIYRAVKWQVKYLSPDTNTDEDNSFGINLTLETLELHLKYNLSIFKKKLKKKTWAKISFTTSLSHDLYLSRGDVIT